MKRLLTMCVALMMAFGVAGCAESTPDVKNAVPPVYESDEQFEIGMWVGISDKISEYDDWGKPIRSRPMTDEEFLAKYRDIADSGVNIAFPGYDYMGDGGNSYNLKALRAAKEVGIKQIIADDDLRRILFQAQTLVTSGAKTESEVVQQVKDAIKIYTESDAASALYGFMIRDEPDETYFENFGFAEKIFKQAAPDLMFYVNLFPVYATNSQLAGANASDDYDYNVYLSHYFRHIKTDYVSYDHYPLYGAGDKTSIEASFLYNMDLFQTQIRDEGAGRRLWTFLQSIEFGGRNRVLSSKADASFQAYSFLAYGGDGIQWFCYASPPANDGATYFGDNALVDRNYEKTATYEYVRATNADIQALMPYYKNFDWKGVMLSEVYDDTENFSYLEGSENVLTSNKMLKKFESTEDAFTGVFEDKDGRQGFLVVNFTDPAKKLQNKVTMTFSDAKYAIVAGNGENHIEALRGGKLELDMKEGEGFFVIPFN